MFGLLDYLKIVGGCAIGIVLTAIYFNGVPILKDLPYVGAVFEGQAKKGLVPEFQAVALRAELDELRRQGKANALVIEAYQEQLRNVWATEAARNEKTEQEIADYERKLAEAGRACLLDNDDIEFLRRRPEADSSRRNSGQSGSRNKPAGLSRRLPAQGSACAACRGAGKTIDPQT